MCLIVILYVICLNLFFLKTSSVGCDFFFFFFPDLLLPTVPFLFDHTISYGTHEKYILALGVIHCFFECLIHYL